MKKLILISIFLLAAMAAWVAVRTKVRSTDTKTNSFTEITSTNPPANMVPITKLDLNRQKSASTKGRGEPEEKNKFEAFTSDWEDVFLPASIPRDQYLERLKLREERVQAVVRKDIADGLNAQVRSKEQKLRILLGRLHLGFSVSEAVQVMGQPDVVQPIVVEPDPKGGGTITRLRAGSVEQVPLGTWISVSYWPRVAVPFDGRNGQGYQVLYLLFDETHKLKGWLWEQPNTYPSLKNPAINRYWEGRHELSSAPPPGAQWQGLASD